MTKSHTITIVCDFVGNHNCNCNFTKLQLHVGTLQRRAPWHCSSKDRINEVLFWLFPRFSNSICLVYRSQSSPKATFINNYHVKNNHTYSSVSREKCSIDLANQEARSVNVICHVHLAPRSASMHPTVSRLAKLKCDTLLFCSFVSVPRVSRTAEKGRKRKKINT